MKKILPIAIATCVGFGTLQTAQAEPNAQRFQLGGGVSHNVVSSPFGGGSSSAAGFNVFVGYEFDAMADIRPSVEIGFSKTGDFYSNTDSDIHGFSVSGVVQKELPELSKSLFVLARGGIDFGDDDGLLLGLGLGAHINQSLDIRGEFISKNASSVYQLNIVYNF